MVWCTENDDVRNERQYGALTLALGSEVLLFVLLFDDMKWLRITLHSGGTFFFANQSVYYAWKTKYVHTLGL